jgi:hypothetical protein
MNRMLFLVATLFSINSWSVLPNLVECSGDKIYVRYQRDNSEWKLFIGKKEDLNLRSNFENDRSPLGKILSFVTETVSDSYTVRLSVIIPEINIIKDGAKVPFGSEVIGSKTMTSEKGRSGVDGLINMVISQTSVNCVASFVR